MPSSGLLVALVDALVRLSVLGQTTSRNTLVDLIRKSCPSVREIAEHPLRRLHVLEIVQACLATPRALHGLADAVQIMTGDDPDAGVIVRLAREATLADLVSPDDLDEGRALLRRAARSVGPDAVVAEFDHLAASAVSDWDEPQALAFADRMAAAEGEAADRLAAWIAATRTGLGIATGPNVRHASPHAVAMNGRTTLDPRLLELLSAQATDTQHPYRFFEGSVPTLAKIYVQQRGESAGGAEVGAVLSVPQMLTAHGNVLVISGPGMGKSTLVWRVQHDQANWWLRRARSDTPDPFDRPELGRIVPIAIPANLLVTHDLGQAFDEATARLGCGASLRDLLDGPPAPDATWLVMVDGVDELLTGDERSTVLGRVRAWIERADPAVRFLIATRPLPYGFLTDLRVQGIAEFGLKGFDRSDLETFTRKWFTARDPHADVEQLAARFLDEVARAGLTALVEIPLLATIAALAFEKAPRRPLPSNRAELYDWFVTHLRHGRRSAATPRDEPSRPAWQRAWQWVDDHVLELLEHLAEGHLDRDPTPTRQRAEAWILRNCPETSIARDPGWRGRVRTLLTNTSLLAEHGTDDVVFTHHSFAEFLAAGPRAADFDPQAWMVDVLSPHRRGRAMFVLARRSVAADDLVESLVDGTDEHAVVAGDILAEGIDVAVPLRQRVVQTLIRQLKGDAPTAPEALRVLAALSDSPEAATALTGIVEDGAGSPLMRVAVADQLDGVDPQGRLLSLSRDPSLPGVVRWLAALRAGDPVAVTPPGPADLQDVTTELAPLPRHFLHAMLNDAGQSAQCRLAGAVTLAVCGDPVGVAALRRCLTDASFRFGQYLVMSRALRVSDAEGQQRLEQVLWSPTASDEARGAAALALAETPTDTSHGQVAGTEPAPERSSGKLLAAIVSELAAAPVVQALADRRLLISMVAHDTPTFERPGEHEATRPHIVGIVRSCLEQPRALRSLDEALAVMAPSDPAVARARRIIGSATLLDVMPVGDVERGRTLLGYAETADDTVWAAIGGTFAVDASDLVDAFDRLVGVPVDWDETPPALDLVDRAAAVVEGPLGVELRSWADLVAIRLDIDRAGGRRGVLAEDPGDSWEPLSGTPPSEDDGSSRDHTWAPTPLESTGAPARLPERIWGGVPPRNADFVGREAILAELHATLSQDGAADALPCVLHGIVGGGKSQVAIEYIYRFMAGYDLIWWIPAGQQGHILSSFVALADRLELAVTPEANMAVPAVLEALSNGDRFGRWLLVFDNAQDHREISHFLPTGTGRVLVTSRNPEWASVARSIEVDVFQRQESVEFLTGRRPSLSSDEADRLAQALGDLPLAVEQAAAWQTSTGMPVDEYLSLLDNTRTELLEEQPTPGSTSVAAVSNVALDQLDNTNRGALQLLQVCAMLAPEPVSRELFTGRLPGPIAVELDELLASPIRLARAIRDIQRYALARYDHRRNTLQMHRLIQAVLIGRMSEEEQASMRRGAHLLLAGANPANPGSPDRWAGYESLYPHVVASRAVESDEPIVEDLIFNIVEYLSYRGDHDGCERLAAEAYRYRLGRRGERHPDTLRLARYLGFVRATLGRHQEAADLYTQTLDAYMTSHGEEAEGTLGAMSSMAHGLRTTGDFAAALDLDERAFRGARSTLGDDDPVTLAAAHGLGMSLRLTGAYRRARELDEDTYRRRVEVLGASAVETFLTFDALAIDMRELGQYISAHRRQEDAYERLCQEFGPHTAVTLNAARHLAVSRRKAGRYSDALDLARQTLDELRSRYGADHPDAVHTAAALAVDLRHAGDLDRSEALSEETVGRYQRVFGPTHPHTVTARVNLAAVRRQRGHVDAAFDVDRTALAALTEALGPDHPSTLMCAVNVANDAFARGEPAMAVEHDTENLGRLERVLGPDHPVTLACNANLAIGLRALGRVPESERILADTRARLHGILVDGHRTTRNVVRRMRTDCDIDPLPL